VTGRSATTDPDRVLTTVVFSDIVGSTKLATRMGDRAWTHLVERHDQLIRDHVGTLGGRVVKSTGDGALIVIDSPSRAIRCALGLAKSLQQLGVPSRFGVHVGEVEVRGDDIGGVAVHPTARIASVAGAGEVATSEVAPPSYQDQSSGSRAWDGTVSVASRVRGRSSSSRGREI
jgi:class 3 adenylate cyclase